MGKTAAKKAFESLWDMYGKKETDKWKRTRLIFMTDTELVRELKMEKLKELSDES